MLFFPGLLFPALLFPALLFQGGSAGEASAKDVSMSRIDPELPPPKPSPSDGVEQGTVLVVALEQSVRSVTRRMLARRGFAALEAAETEGALRLMQAHADEIVGVVLDLGMPAWLAEVTFEALRLGRPTLPVLFTGGFGDEILATRLAGTTGTDFLPKPFGLDALGAKADHLFSH